MPDLSHLPWSINALVFVAAAGVIAAAGVKLAGLADRIADRTGLGEALTGTLFLGFTTALPGLAASITAALEGHAALAISNAVGGIAIQTTFLAMADLAYQKANLEHAAASLTNLLQTGVLILLLTLLLLGLAGPDVTLGPVHPMTPVLLATALLGFWLSYRAGLEPMWRPRQTGQTVPDVPDEAHEGEPLPRLLIGFSTAAVAVTLAGVVVGHTAGNLTESTGLNETVVGGLFTAIVASLPEGITTVAAVRRGALTLAVSDIVGGNFFDVLFVFAADLAFLGGSIYHGPGVGGREVFLTALAVLLNVILLLGLLYRQRSGPANIGVESVLLTATYAVGFLVLALYM